MATPTPRVRMPATARKGEVLEIKTLISHDMESGQRKDADGKTVFTADWHPSISANPYQSFFLRAEESGSLTMAWTDDDGSVYRAVAKLTVT